MGTRTSDLIQEENQQVTFLKYNLFQDIPAEKNSFTKEVGHRMKGPKNSIWKRRQQKQGREEEWEQHQIHSVAPIAADNIIVFSTLRTQPYHKAEKQTELSTMATFTCLITSPEGFQQDHWKHIHRNSCFHFSIVMQKIRKVTATGQTHKNPMPSFSIKEFVQMHIGFV